MISLTPKKRFQETDMAGAFRTIVTSTAFETAMTQALAEFTLTKAPSSEQLSGVRSFIDVLLNLAEVEQDLPQFPVKHISVSPDLRRKTLPQPPKPPQQAQRAD